MMPVYAQGVVFAVQKNKEPEKGIPEGWSWAFAKLRADKKIGGKEQNVRAEACLSLGNPRAANSREGGHLERKGNHFIFPAGHSLT